MISVYRLNPDGTVPDFVIDGGYFPHKVEGSAPQDWDLLGITTEEAPGTPFSDVDALEAYLISIGGESWTDFDGAPVDLVAQASWLWSRQ